MHDDVVKFHPCFSAYSNGYGRIHLPVAPKCNIRCGYCDIRYDCVNESRPGVTSKVLSPGAAVVHIKKHDTVNNRLKVIGIAGPGEPLFNEETFETLKQLQKHFPEKIKCISTNGLLLAENVEVLSKYGIDSISVTVNTLSPNIADQIYLQKAGLSSLEFIERQLAGIRSAVRKGITVKVNMVAIKGINTSEVSSIAKVMGDAGVYILNIIPLLPQAKFSKYAELTIDELQALRESVKQHILVMRHCRRCRADAVGLV